jgi:hypothetical protein
MRQELQIPGSNLHLTQLNRGLQEMVRSLPEPSWRRLPALISLSGKMGSGKDSAGALLSMVGYNCVSWAEALKRETWDSLCQRIPPPMPSDVHAAWMRMEPQDVYIKPTSSDARKVLQYWGTEYRRSQDPLYWIKALHNSLAPGTLYAITDTRLPIAEPRHGGSTYRLW